MSITHWPPLRASHVIPAKKPIRHSSMTSNPTSTFRILASRVILNITFGWLESDLKNVPNWRCLQRTIWFSPFFSCSMQEACNTQDSSCDDISSGPELGRMKEATATSWVARFWSRKTKRGILRNGTLKNWYLTWMQVPEGARVKPQTRIHKETLTFVVQLCDSISFHLRR